MEQIVVKRAGYHPQQKQTQMTQQQQQHQVTQLPSALLMNPQEQIVNDMIKEVGRVFAVRDMQKRGLEKDIAEAEDQLRYVEAETFKQAEALGVCCAATSYHKFQLEKASGEIANFSSNYIDTYEAECEKLRAISEEVNEIADTICSDLLAIKETYADTVTAPLPVARATFREIIARHKRDEEDLADKRERASQLCLEAGRLQGSLDSSLLALESATVENDELQIDIQMLLNRLFVSDVSLADASAVASAEGQELARFSAARDEALLSKEDELQRLQSKVDQVTLAIQESTLLLSSKQTALQEVTARLEEVLSSASASATALVEKSSELAAEERLTCELQSNTAHLSLQTAQVKESAATARSGLENMLRGAAAMRAQASEVAARLPLAVNELMRLGAEVPNLKIELNSAQERRRQHIISLAEQTAAHSAAAKAMEERCYVEEQAMAALQRGVDAARAEASDAEAALAAAVAEHAAWVQRRALAEERAEEARESQRLQEVQARVDAKQSAVASVREECQVVEGQVDERSRQLSLPRTRGAIDANIKHLPEALQRSLSAELAVEIRDMEAIINREHSRELRALQGHLAELRARMASSTFLQRERADVEMLKAEIASCTELLAGRKNERSLVRAPRRQQQQRWSGDVDKENATSTPSTSVAADLNALSPSPAPRKASSLARDRVGVPANPSPDFLFDEYVPKYK